MSGIIKELACEGDPARKTASSSCRLGWGGKRILKLRHSHPGNAVNLEAIVPGLSVNYDFRSKDILVERKTVIRAGDLSIRQRIPYQKLYLVPSPELKIAFKPLSLPASIRSETTLMYDFQNSYGTIQQDLVARSRYRASATINSRTGPRQASYTLTAKTGKPLLSSVGLNLTRAFGPVLKLEGALLSNQALRLKADVQLQGKETKLEISHPVLNKARVALTSTIRTDKSKARSVVLGARLELLQ